MHGSCILGRLFDAQGDYQAAIGELRVAIGLNPSYALARHALGHALHFSGDPAAAIPELELAERLSPRDPILWTTQQLRGVAFIALRQFEDALAAAEDAIRHPQAGFWAHATKTTALASLGRIDEAKSAIQKVFELKPDFSIPYV